MDEETFKGKMRHLLTSIDTTTRSAEEIMSSPVGVDMDGIATLPLAIMDLLEQRYVSLSEENEASMVRSFLRFECASIKSSFSETQKLILQRSLDDFTEALDKGMAYSGGPGGI